MTAGSAPSRNRAALSGGGGQGRIQGGRAGEYRHLAPLMAQFTALRPGDPRRRVLRDELAAGYWPLVVNIARRYRNRGEPLDDLEQVGAVGLLAALERFDPARRHNFLSFAIPTITGEIRRYFRDRTWSMHVPRRLKDLHTHVRTATDALTVSMGRSPKPSEIAAYLHLGLDEVVETLSAQLAYTAESLDALMTPDGLTLTEVLGTDDTALITAAYRQELRQALATLPERDRTIVILRFFADLTQSQIAARVGLSQMHVSRVLSRSLATLRECLDAS